VRHTDAAIDAEALLTLTLNKNRLQFYQGSAGNFSSTRYSGNRLMFDQTHPDRSFTGDLHRCGPPAERKPRG